MTNPRFSKVVATSHADLIMLPDLITLPKVEVRLSALQGQSLSYGLKKVVIACLNVKTGLRPNPRIPVGVYPPKGDVYPEFIECIRELWTVLYPTITQPRRLRARLSVFQISTCALVIRACVKHQRHGHFQISSKRPALVRKRILVSLERHRRIARAASVREIGRERYATLHQCWLRFSSWLRFFALDCRCGKPFRVVHHRHLWLSILNDAVAVTKRELSECNVDVPEAKLRRWVRQAISNVRRGRTGWKIRTLVHEQTGANYLRHYVLRRICEEENDEREPFTTDVHPRRDFMMTMSSNEQYKVTSRKRQLKNESEDAAIQAHPCFEKLRAFRKLGGRLKGTFVVECAVHVGRLAVTFKNTVIARNLHVTEKTIRNYRHVDGLSSYWKSRIAAGKSYSLILKDAALDPHPDTPAPEQRSSIASTTDSASPSKPPSDSGAPALAPSAVGVAATMPQASAPSCSDKGGLGQRQLRAISRATPKTSEQVALERRIEKLRSIINFTDSPQRREELERKLIQLECELAALADAAPFKSQHSYGRPSVESSVGGFTRRATVPSRKIRF